VTVPRVTKYGSGTSTNSSSSSSSSSDSFVAVSTDADSAGPREAHASPAVHPSPASPASQGPIRCVMYCEFDNIDGPRMYHQYPPNFLSTEKFDAIAKFIITDDVLQENPLSITAFDYTFVGFPVGIPGTKYGRSKMLFNLCFVFDAGSNMIAAHVPVVCKLGEFIRSLEVESEYLFQQDKTRPAMGALLPDLWENLNLRGQHECNVTPLDMLCLKVFQPILRDRPSNAPGEESDPMMLIQSHRVPVLIRRLDAETQQHLGATTLHLLPYIDGIRHVHRIALEADCAIDLVKTIIDQLLSYDVVRMIDIFQYSNLYVP